MSTSLFEIDDTKRKLLKNLLYYIDANMHRIKKKNSLFSASFLRQKREDLVQAKKEKKELDSKIESLEKEISTICLRTKKQINKYTIDINELLKRVAAGAADRTGKKEIENFISPGKKEIQTEILHRVTFLRRELRKENEREKMIIEKILKS